MKGVIFTEFLDMVEDEFGLRVANNIIEKVDAPSEGAYTSVGTYPCSELVGMLGALSASTNLPVGALLETFGRHLFPRFKEMYPGLFGNDTTCFDFLRRLDGEIHAEVKKLYPDAELPKFSCKDISESAIEMIYESPRGLGGFAHGLLNRCCEHFSEDITCTPTDLSEGKGTHVRFELVKNT